MDSAMNNGGMNFNLEGRTVQVSRKNSAHLHVFNDDFGNSSVK